MVGDGEAETGPLATAWHSNKFLNPATDGAVLPILHLNGYKIANPTLLARITREELEQLFRGYGWAPYFVEGHDPDLMHEAMAATLDTAVEQLIRAQLQADARDRGNITRPRWPMIILNSPKGWTRAEDGGRSPGGGRLSFASGANHGPPPPIPGTCNCWRSGCAVTIPRSSSMSGAASSRNSPHWRPPETVAWGPILTPTAGCSSGTSACRISAGYAAADAIARRTPGIGDTHVLGPFLRDIAKTE